MAKRSQMKTPGGGRGGGGVLFSVRPPYVRGRHVFSNRGEMVHTVPTRTHTHTQAQTHFLSRLFRGVRECACVRASLCARSAAKGDRGAE